jgi:hypothetical protein
VILTLNCYPGRVGVEVGLFARSLGRLSPPILSVLLLEPFKWQFSIKLSWRKALKLFEANSHAETAPDSGGAIRRCCFRLIEILGLMRH